VTPYRLGQALVIGDQQGDELATVDDECDSAECEAVRERCGENAYADVVLDEDGEVADVVCFRGNARIVELGDEAVDSAEAGNNTVLVLDGEDDGADVTGDVTLSGNNAVLYGEGAGVSVVGGSVNIEKNNAVVRGVTINGDVVIDKNNAQLTFTTILGDLTIAGNNTTLAECTVFGTLRVLGNNTVLVQNELAEGAELTGKNLRCNANVGFEDANDDAEVSEDELGDEVVCPGDKDPAP
jgi:hypothetical protein